MTAKTKNETNKPATRRRIKADICQNIQCKYHTPQGCRLFDGASWLRCRKAIRNGGAQ